ncbi:VOC family protein [Streptomyces shenzhenensis]|uniref:VOC family protein n=1 Tax=Streptomyces shenzhenensis TaxID=943815 RepID=UPI00380368E1
MKLSKQGLDLGLIVTDLEAMTAFYRDLLGLPEVGRRTNGWGRMVELGAGSSVIRLLLPTRSARSVPGDLLALTGVRYITFPVADIDETSARLADSGAPLVLPMTEVGTARFVMYADPEGNAVELFQRVNS